MEQVKQCCAVQNDDIHDLSLELIKYGELAQLTYDTMINRNIYSDSFGDSLFPAMSFIGPHRPFLGSAACEYKVYNDLRIDCLEVEEDLREAK